MNYKIELSNHFKKEAKRLSKKYPSLKLELIDLFSELEKNPLIGIPLGNDIFKIRLAIASKNKGKSGGTRVIYYVQIDNTSFCFFQYLIKERKILLLIKKFKN